MNARVIFQREGERDKPVEQRDHTLICRHDFVEFDTLDDIKELAAIMLEKLRREKPKINQFIIERVW